jgi:hypothetical protein
MGDIIDAFYACIILCNMEVMERMESGDGVKESEMLYDCVDFPLDDIVIEHTQ